MTTKKIEYLEFMLNKSYSIIESFQKIFFTQVQKNENLFLQNTSTATILQASVDNTRNDLTTLQGTVSGQTSNITTLQGTVAGHTSSINTNTTNIATNTSNITALQSVLTLYRWNTVWTSGTAIPSGTSNFLAFSASNTPYMSYSNSVFTNTSGSTISLMVNCSLTIFSAASSPGNGMEFYVESNSSANVGGINWTIQATGQMRFNITAMFTLPNAQIFRIVYYTTQTTTNVSGEAGYISVARLN